MRVADIVGVTWTRPAMRARASRIAFRSIIGERDEARVRSARRARSRTAYRRVLQRNNVVVFGITGVAVVAAAVLHFTGANDVLRFIVGRGGAVAARHERFERHGAARRAPRSRRDRHAAGGARQSARIAGLRVRASRRTGAGRPGRADRFDPRELAARARHRDPRRRSEARPHALRRRVAAHDRLAHDAGRRRVDDSDARRRAAHAGGGARSAR